MGYKARDFRAKARGVLHADYGLLMAAYVVFSLLLGAASSVVFVGALILGGPLTVGYAQFCLDASRAKALDFTRLFGGFMNFAQNLLLYLVNQLLIFLWSLLLLVPGIVKAYAYSMSYYLAADHPDWSHRRARQESERMMRGHKWRLFCLHISFIGWVLLSILTFGILMLVYVGPYIRQAEAEFYLDLTGRDAAATA